jgi:hypothetical protein
VTLGTAAYEVSIAETAEGWRVRITDTAGAIALERGCRDGSEARTFASTVRQHLYWLSPERFREYYEIQER